MDGGHEGSEAGALLKLGKLEDDDEGWPERLGGADDEVEGLSMVYTRDLKKTLSST